MSAIGCVTGAFQVTQIIRLTIAGGGIPMSISVELKSYELAQACQTGYMRHIKAIEAGYDQDRGIEREANHWQRHIEGACGEIAVAKAMKVYWGGGISTFDAHGDIDGTGWEVRTRSKHGHDLILRHGDKDDRKYILVTGTAPKYEVHGWILGADAKQQKYLKFVQQIGRAFFIPQQDLQTLGSLK